MVWDCLSGTPAIDRHTGKLIGSDMGSSYCACACACVCVVFSFFAETFDFNNLISSTGKVSDRKCRIVVVEEMLLSLL